MADLVYDESMSPLVYGMATTDEQLAMLVTTPLQPLAGFVTTRDSATARRVASELPFDVSGSPPGTSTQVT